MEIAGKRPSPAYWSTLGMGKKAREGGPFASGGGISRRPGERHSGGDEGSILDAPLFLEDGDDAGVVFLEFVEGEGVEVVLAEHSRSAS